MGLRDSSSIVIIMRKPLCNRHLPADTEDAGIQSKTRKYLPENAGIDDPIRYPENAYRALISREKMMSTPLTARLMESNHMFMWLGENKCALAYPVAAGKLYNVAIAVEDPDMKLPLGVNTPVDPAEVRELFKDFCPEVTALMGLLDEVMLWPMGEMPKLNTWVSKSGRLVLIGDAAVSTRAGVYACLTSNTDKTI